MTRHVLLAIVVALGLAGCGSDNAGEKAEKAFQDVVITRNPDNTFSFKAGDQAISNISSVQVTDEKKDQGVSAFLEAPVADDGGGGNLCCNSCSLSGGVLICTGCVRC